MEPLEQNRDVKTVTALMESNGRHQMSVDLLAILVIIAELERRNRALEQEHRAMKQEVAELRARTSPQASEMEAAVSATQNCVDGVKEQLSAMRQTVVSWAKDTAERVRLHGVSALDRAVSVLRIKPMMQAAQSAIQGALESVRAAVDRGEEMGFQLREAGRALGNAFRAARGREQTLTPAVQEGNIQKAALAPSRAVKGILNGMNEAAMGGIRAVERLEQAGRNSRERLTEKKPSVRAELEQGKRDAAKPAAPAAVRKTQEAAL